MQCCGSQGEIMQRMLLRNRKQIQRLCRNLRVELPVQEPDQKLCNMKEDYIYECVTDFSDYRSVICSTTEENYFFFVISILRNSNVGDLDWRLTSLCGKRKETSSLFSVHNHIREQRLPDSNSRSRCWAGCVEHVLLIATCYTKMCSFKPCFVYSTVLL